MKNRRGTTNRNARGNTADRRNRRKFLLDAWASDVPGHCRCYRCGTLLTAETLTVDRIIPGAAGGTYVRNNIRPCCGTCNSITAPAAKPPRRAKKAVAKAEPVAVLPTLTAYVAGPANFPSTIDMWLNQNEPDPDPCRCEGAYLCPSCANNQEEK